MSLLESFSGTSNESKPWSGLLTPVAGYWDEKKRKKSSPKFGLFKDEKQSKIVWPNFGPGGAIGIGCGAGVGIGITGGAGVGAVPWNALRIVLGVGFGCGVGLGYGYGQGYGVLWDRRPKKNSAQSKRVVIEI
ncbi:hypothetical protein MPTK1_6g07000 [Marchantia polymorpha subsp. ruderalis]|uniref:Uncharacterized protein n=2 Tax=Marchantia polymorpha TaxID=3197 RepID=A0AAF6BPD0_MARPO|nr:hypothetical protein MARPO_0053s0015 [Marchantia polymorpha]PTQ38067.1 hypothetical protein MARPO_0053s0015 [Marchantia polymorpha]BBN13864.1 hypothetical protein Mp_6g07000 [Marchantia polymorpha subsp. ruderalis]BBN13865.1 hypothetical protein Mp_6g07000 [Marchantia polymorpha subsp. ruderalis]|eukprot:PTQ38066.1 hypothetical protein MARPO_0053s0015 [Marchantia polymorpha]